MALLKMMRMLARIMTPNLFANSNDIDNFAPAPTPALAPAPDPAPAPSILAAALCSLATYLSPRLGQ